VELWLLRLLRPAPATADEASLGALTARVAALERTSQRADTPRVSVPAAAPAAGLAAAGSAAPAGAEAVPAAAAATPAAGAPAPEAVPPPEDGFTLEQWREEWPVVIEAVTRVDSMLAGVLRDCRPVEAGPGRLVIGTQHRFHIDKISDAAKTAVVAEAAASVAGRPVAVETRFTAPSGPAEQAPSGTVSDATRAVLQTFSGSRVVATRLRDDGGHAPQPRPGA
jgi:hypothetical protein